MVNYKEKRQDLSNIRFVNHKHEFNNFFKNHKRFCDEISGVKYSAVGELDTVKKTLITRNNFDVGIKKTNAYIINNMYLIDDNHKIRIINGRFHKLEIEYLEDTIYHNYVYKENNLSKTQDVDFTARYIRYVIKCFEIASQFNDFLQESINLSGTQIIRKLAFVDYDAFFDNLSIYREEMADNIADLSFTNVFEKYKKLMGYFYSYQYLFSIKNSNQIKQTLGRTLQLITSEESIRIILKLKDNVELTSSFKKESRQKLMTIRNGFNVVLNACNFSLSLRNVLPKSKDEVLYDRTLI